MHRGSPFLEYQELVRPTEMAGKMMAPLSALMGRSLPVKSMSLATPREGHPGEKG